MAATKLEVLLNMLGRELADHQVARFFKIPEAMTQTPVDYIGYTRIGRAILIEAKEVNVPRLPIGTKPGLLPHQWSELVEANRAGALALICWAKHGKVATIGVDQAVAYAAGKKSIPWEAIPETYIREFSASRRLQILDHWLPLPIGLQPAGEQSHSSPAQPPVE